MAAQKDDVTAEVVGHAFVGQFYSILHSQPGEVYRFYQDSSTMSRPDSSGELVTVTSMDGIRDLILSLDCKDYKAEILTADAQGSHVNGVVVLVTGCLTGKDNVKRMFTESFFLAPQDNGYFVLNDVFRFVGEASLAVATLVEEPVPENSQAEPVSAVAPVEETDEISLSPPDNDTPVAEGEVETPAVSVAHPKSVVTEKAVPQSSVASSVTVEPVVEATSNGHVDAPKKSYASLLMNGKVAVSKALGQPATTYKPVKQSPAPKSGASPSVVQTATVPVASAPAAVSVSSPPNGNASRNGHVEDKGYSIYIGDLPYNATIGIVEQEFKRFGLIKRNGIQVRSNKNYCFGFVEFEEASAKESALKADRIQIGNKLVRIEDKVTPTRVVNGMTYNAGRGGSRNDGFRRNNFSSGRGYVRNDYGKGNGEVSSHGNSRNGNGYAYQTSGGRGARQGGAPK